MSAAPNIPTIVPDLCDVCDVPEFTTNPRLRTLALLRVTVQTIQRRAPADDLPLGEGIAECLEIIEDGIRDALQDARSELVSILSASTRLAALERRLKELEKRTDERVGDLEVRMARAELTHA
jgi:hypothetical protein